MNQRGVRVMRGVVKEVHPKKIVLNDGSDVPYGLLVWSTGVGASDFVKSLNFPKSPGGRYSNKSLTPSLIVLKVTKIMLMSDAELVLMNGCVFLLWKMCLLLGIVLVFSNKQEGPSFQL